MRYPDWEDRFVKALREKAKVPYDIAGNDCVRFAADVIQAYTGTDIAASLRHSYKNKEDSAKLIAESKGGFFGLVERALDELGICEYMGPSFAQRGDLVFIEIRGQYALGICNGDSSATAGRDGVVWVSSKHTKVAWEIPSS
jgi:hypothetical protein